MTTIQQAHHLIIFELSVGGHYAGYIHHLLTLCPATPTLRISVVVTPSFMTLHSDAVRGAADAAVPVDWIPITSDEANWYQTMKSSLVKQAWAEWRLFCRYAVRVGATQGLVMYLDRFQLPLALGLPAPIPLSGIYFRPKLHYSQLPGYQPTLTNRWQARRERLLWHRTLHHPAFKTLFCLDPLAVATLQKLAKQTPVVHLPDPVAIYPASVPAPHQPTRSSLGIEPHRQIFLLFGVLNARKGIYQLLDALTLLPEEVQHKIALLLVGPVAAADEPQFCHQLEKLRSEQPATQIIVCNQFIQDEAIQPFFELADTVLTLYQQHVGMSAILVRAGAARKPVLASNYGLMGKLVTDHALGLAIDSTQPKEIAQGLLTFLTTEPSQRFDQQAAAQFAQNNSAAQFAQTIWEQLVTE